MLGSPLPLKFWKKRLGWAEKGFRTVPDFYLCLPFFLCFQFVASLGKIYHRIRKSRSSPNLACSYQEWLESVGEKSQWVLWWLDHPSLSLKQRTSEIWYREKDSFRHDGADQSIPSLLPKPAKWNTRENMLTPYAKNKLHIEMNSRANRETCCTSDKNQENCSHSHPPPRGCTTPRQLHTAIKHVCVCAHTYMHLWIFSFTT